MRLRREKPPLEVLWLQGLYMGGGGYGIDQNPHSGGGANGVNVTTLNPGTFELSTFYDLLYEIPVFWAVV